MSVVVIVAVGANGDGRREVLGMAVGPSEAETFWTDFLRSLGRRGLRGVKLEQDDEWAVQRRYMSLETLAPLREAPTVSLLAAVS